MPDHKTHVSIDRMLFGKEFVKVHHEKDVYSKFLGPSHRRVAHDPISNVIIAVTQYPEDPLGAFLAASVHDAVDRASTAAKMASRRHGGGSSRRRQRTTSILGLLLGT